MSLIFTKQIGWWWWWWWWWWRWWWGRRRRNNKEQSLAYKSNPNYRNVVFTKYTSDKLT
jgi:hypothetical protein